MIRKISVFASLVIAAGTAFASVSYAQQLQTIHFAPNTVAPAICDAAGAGKIYFSGTDNTIKRCNGAAWGNTFTDTNSGGTVTNTGSSANFIPLFTTASNITNSLIFQSGINIGIGTITPAYKLDVVGDVNITGNYKINGVNFNASQWTTSVNDIFNTNTGNVGIGNSNPTGLLHVSSSIIYASSTTGRVGIGTTAPASRLDITSGVDDIFRLTRTGAAFPTIFKEGIDGALVVNNANLDTFVIKNGNVGIGTTAPESNLDVRQPTAQVGVNNSGITITNRSGWGGTALTVNAKHDGTNWIRRDSLLAATLVSMNTNESVDPASFQIMRASPGTGIISWSDLFRINYNGNVGIGTAAPAYKLDVNGSINATAILVNGVPVGGGGSSQWTTSFNDIYYNAGNVGIGTTAPTVKLHVANGNLTVENANTYTSIRSKNNSLSWGSSFTAENDTGNRIVIDMLGSAFGPNNSLFGISNGNNMARFFTQDISSGFLIGSFQSTPVVFGTTNIERMRITETGNIGIGTSGPTEKLHVVGNLLVTGSITAGSLSGPTSVAAGNVSAGMFGSNFGNGNFSFPANVGIGATTPGSLLHLVNGTAGKIRMDTTSADVNARNWEIGANATSFGDLQFWQSLTNGGVPVSGNARFTIDINGNVGIGTAGPASRLDITSGVDEILRLTRTGATFPTIFKEGIDGALVVNNANLDTFVIKNGNVGIGTAAPVAKLDVNTSANADGILTRNGGNSINIVAKNTGWGDAPLIDLHNGEVNGKRAFISVDTGTVKFFTVPSTHMSFDVNGGIEYLHMFPNGHIGVNGSWDQGSIGTIFNGTIGENGVTIRDSTDGNNAYFMDFLSLSGRVGSINRVGTSLAVSYGTTSDRRLKENVATTTDGLATLMRIPVNDFNFIGDPNKTRTQGFIAQDLFKYYPAAVLIGGDDPNKSPWSVDYGRLTPLLVKSVQEQQEKINKLEKENEELKAKISALEKK